MRIIESDYVHDPADFDLLRDGIWDEDEEEWYDDENAESIIKHYSDKADSWQDSLETAIDRYIENFVDESTLPYDWDKDKFLCSDDELAKSFYTSSIYDPYWMQNEFDLSDYEAGIIEKYMIQEIIKWYGSNS